MPDPVQELYGNRIRVRVCGLLMDQGGLLMVNHSSLGRSEFWAPPGGGLNFGETVTDGLIRELKEETGLVTEPGELLFVSEFNRPPLHAVELFFLVNRISGTLLKGIDPEMKDGDQIIREVRFLTWEELEKMAPDTLHGIFQLITDPSQIMHLRGYFRV